jgi:hypothetical protein
MEFKRVLEAVEEFVEWYEKTRKIRSGNNANKDS